MNRSPGIYMGILALIMLGIAGFFGVRNMSIINGGAQVQGTIIGADAHREVDDSGAASGGTSMSPVYSYTYRGHTYTKHSHMVGGSHGGVGSSVTLIVDPNHPQNALADTFMEKWFLIVLFGGLGLLFGIISLLFFRASVSSSSAQ